MSRARRPSDVTESFQVDIDLLPSDDSPNRLKTGLIHPLSQQNAASHLALGPTLPQSHPIPDSQLQLAATHAWCKS